MHLGYSPFVFLVGFSARVRPGKNCSGIIRSSAKQKNWKKEKSNQRILLCLKISISPDRFYLKPPTPLQKFGWMEKKYTNTEMKRMSRALLSHRETAGILWIFRETVQVKAWRSELFRYMRAIMEIKSVLYTEHEAIVF